MIKKKLLKAVMLGLCMAALTTGSAFAMEAGGGNSGTIGKQSELDAMYEKQAVIDKILFEDNLKEIERLGFMVNYTGVVEDYIEVGISPYTDEFANFIYDLVGRDAVKVIEMDQSIIYASGVAPDQTTTDVVTDAEVIMDKGNVEDADLAAVSGLDEDAGDEEMQIQIESIGDLDDKNASKEVLETVSADANGEIRTISTDADAVVEDEGVSTPMVILGIIAAAGLIGGAILISSKKKISK